MKNLFILFVLVAALSQLNAQTPSSEDVDKAIVALFKAINSKRTTIGARNQAEDLKKSKGKGKDFPLIGGFLRLSFHDCLGDGGCDGCLDLQHPSNKGLDEPAGILNKLYDENNGFGMSRADFYALAGWTAVDVAPLRRKRKGFMNLAKENGIEFQFGREDCETSPEETTDDADYPGSCFDMEKSVDFFEEKFDFTPEETVAIMGAHTLGFIRNGLPKGRATEWVTGGGCSSRMNSKLYLLMLDGRLRPGKKEGEDGLCFWHRSVGAFLDSDLSLAYKFTRNEDNSITCGDHTFIPGVRKDADLDAHCEKADGYDQIVEYRENNDKFVLDFAKAYDKMLTHGFDDLESVAHEEPALVMKSNRGKPGKRRNKRRRSNTAGNSGGRGRRRKRMQRHNSDAPSSTAENVEDMLDDIAEEIVDIRDEIE